VVMWGRQAETVTENFRKGNKILVKGLLHQWDNGDKSGYEIKGLMVGLVPRPEATTAVVEAPF